MSEELNKNFHKVFTTESLQKRQGQKRKNEMWEIRIKREEMKEMMEEFD